MNTFICAACGCQFPCDPVEEVDAEARERFGVRQASKRSDWVDVCTDCYREMERRGILDLPVPPEYVEERH